MIGENASIQTSDNFLDDLVFGFRWVLLAITVFRFSCVFDGAWKFVSTS